MEKTLTPKDLADAIGVSESSLRRWVDSGAIQTYRTKGGHRRIPVAEGLRFVRESGSTLLRPEVLGLVSGDIPAGQAPADQLFEALLDGSFERASAVAMSLFLSGMPVSQLCDGPIRDAMHRVGDLWRHDRRGILQEHRATEICIRLLHQLRESVAAPASGAPMAVGGAPEDDLYVIPSLMADLVLTELGFNTMNFGARTPADLLADAAEERRASIVWLSISVSLPKEQMRFELHRLARKLNDTGRMLIVGGRHAADINLSPMPNVVLAGSMAQMADVAKGVLTAWRQVGRAGGTDGTTAPPDHSGE